MAAGEWLIWQLVDSAYPVGAFAHSNGLEAAWQHGLVTDGPTLEQFIRTSLQQSIRGVLGFVQAAWNQPETFADVDERCDLFLNNQVANRASRAQGRAFLAVATRVFATGGAVKLSAAVRSTEGPTHLVPVFGLVLRSLGVDFAQTISLFRFMHIRGCLSGAVRLGIIGPLEAQQIQSRARSFEAEKKQAEFPVQTAPLLDLLQGTQGRLYSRMFQS